MWVSFPKTTGEVVVEALVSKIPEEPGAAAIVPIATWPFALIRSLAVVSNVWNTTSPADEYTAAPPTLWIDISAALSLSSKIIFGYALLIWKGAVGLVVPIPILPFFKMRSFSSPSVANAIP